MSANFASPRRPSAAISAPPTASAARDDADFQRAVAHYHKGEWTQAIAILQPLSKRYPQDRAVTHILEEAEFKARLETGAKVRAKRWIIPWRRILLTTAFVVATVLLAWTGTTVLRNGIRPILAQAAEQRTQARLLADGNAFLAAGELDAAEEKFSDLLARVPDHVEAQAGLALVQEERRLADLYAAALRAEEAGDVQGALERYATLQVERAGYRDSAQRITRLRRWQDIDALLVEAETLTLMLLPNLAVERYQQARALDLNYRHEEVVPALVTLYDQLARQIVEATPAQPERINEAIEYWDQALNLETTNKGILEERRLARLFVEGQTFSLQSNWAYAVNRFQAIFDERRTYLDGLVAARLYDVLISNGDSYRNGDDCTLAYDQYAKAAKLPVDDTAVALARMSEAQPCLTPTPTPSNTPLPTGTPLPTAPPATGTPTPTPFPLLAFRGKIVFKSDNPEQPGMWVMDPDGSNRQYLGPIDSYEEQYLELRYAETFSPDRTLRVYVTDLDGRAQVFIDYSNHPQFKSIGNRELTRMTGIAYDPVWSPDGGTIAYVTQENESDDIWLMDADGDHQRAVMRNDWEWDKHPSWSPDSTRIVFWSNRNGLKQIYIMDTYGKVLMNLSNGTGSDEYDPIWIK